MNQPRKSKSPPARLSHVEASAVKNRVRPRHATTRAHPELAEGPSNCSATNQDGTPCGAYRIAGSQYCFHHDPDRAAERHRSRRKGGYARHGRRIRAPGASDAGPPVVLETMADVADLLQATINDALQLENSIRRARTIGYLAGLLLKALDIATLEERVTQVEHVLQSRDHIK